MHSSFDAWCNHIPIHLISTMLIYYHLSFLKEILHTTKPNASKKSKNISAMILPLSIQSSKDYWNHQRHPQGVSLSWFIEFFFVFQRPSCELSLVWQGKTIYTSLSKLTVFIFLLLPPLSNFCLFLFQSVLFFNK